MAISHGRPKRRSTGKRYKKVGAKKVKDLGRAPTHTSVGEKKLRNVRGRGDNRKYALFSVDVANVLDRKTKKAVKAKITRVLENPANRNYVRRNVITKGAVLETEKGKAKVTSRPGQDGTVNAVLVE